MDQSKENTEMKENNVTNSKKNLNNRCNHIECSKKLQISDMKCKCELIFCSLHRLSEQHSCTFDYKNTQNHKKIIDSMRCVSNKISKI
jgi:predicted nucleic acid binding AN1-type Zn finger protein